MSSDEERFALYGEELVAALRRDGGRWLFGLIDARLPGASEESIGEAVGPVLEAMVAKLEALVALDIDDQNTTPLSIARSSLAPLTRFLSEAGAAGSYRDRDSLRLNPQDFYELGPDSLDDISPEVQAAGIRWGAAKAHIHLKRHAS